jgi:hypothetical protein
LPAAIGTRSKRHRKPPGARQRPNKARLKTAEAAVIVGAC